MAAFVRFIETTDPNTIRKTRTWRVVAARDNAVCLGMIKWFGRWRKYCYFSAGQNVIFDTHCMQEIVNFIETKTKEQE